MKKTILVFALICALVVNAFAAELLPCDILRSEDGNEIQKIYEFESDIDSTLLPREPFELSGYTYSCIDVLRRADVSTDIKTHTETVKNETTKNDTDTISAAFPLEVDIVTEDGYTGILSLDESSIMTTASSYGSTSKEYTVTRTYPNLMDADSSLIPKTIEDGATLQNIEWQTIYMSDFTERYSAVATYTGTKSSSYVKGYTTTANYVGEVSKTVSAGIRYTVIFSGTPIAATDSELSDVHASAPTIASEPVKVGENWIVPLLLVIMLLEGGAIAWLFIKYRGETQ